jgi:hypothetical protein
VGSLIAEHRGELEAGGQISVLNDVRSGPDLYGRSLSRTAHRLGDLALFPVSVEPANGRGDAGGLGISVTYEPIRQ